MLAIQRLDNLEELLEPFLLDSTFHDFEELSAINNWLLCIRCVLKCCDLWLLLPVIDLVTFLIVLTHVVVKLELVLH